MRLSRRLALLSVALAVLPLGGFFWTRQDWAAAGLALLLGLALAFPLARSLRTPLALANTWLGLHTLLVVWALLRGLPGWPAAAVLCAALAAWDLDAFLTRTAAGRLPDLPGLDGMPPLQEDDLPGGAEQLAPPANAEAYHLRALAWAVLLGLAATGLAGLLAGRLPVALRLVPALLLSLGLVIGLILLARLARRPRAPKPPVE
jgi:hypothetical protein